MTKFHNYFLSTIICFCFISIGLLSPISVNVQASDQTRLMIAPDIFELKLEKGEVFSGVIKIYNKGEAPLPLEAVVSNFDAEEISGTAVFYDNLVDSNEVDDFLFSPRRWIKIGNPNFILSPEETVRVKFTVSVPENAEDGGHYAVIFFEPKVSSNISYQNETGVSVVSKIGTLFLISIGERKKPTDNSFLIVSEFSIPENFHLKKIENSVISITGLISTAYAETIKTFSVVETSQLQFNLHIKNNDAYHIKPSGKLAILSNSGKTIGETEIKKTTILPGKTRQIPVDFDPEIPVAFKKLPGPLLSFISKNLFFGKYHASLVLDIDGISKKEEIEFWIFPWKLFLVTAFILAILILIRKRIKKAVKVLIKR